MTKVADAEAQAQAGIHGAQAQALLVLSRLGGCTISQLAAHLELGKPAASTLVARMEAAGLLTRQPDRDDARATILVLTANGDKALRDVKQLISDLDQRLTRGFSQQEREVVARFLSQAAQIDKS